MRTPTRLLPASLAASALLAVSGCAGATVTQLWRDPNYRAQPGDRVAVAAVTPHGTSPVRFESAIAQELGNRGFQVATASSAFPRGRPDKYEAKKYMKDNAVVLLVVMQVAAEPAPPVTVTSTVAQTSGWYGGYGGVVATQTTTLSQGTDAHARFDVFDVRTDPDTRIWSGVSSTVDMDGAAQSLAEQFVKQILAAGILVK
jgi:hypothetical protein